MLSIILHTPGQHWILFIFVPHICIAFSNVSSPEMLAGFKFAQWLVGVWPGANIHDLPRLSCTLGTGECCSCKSSCMDTKDCCFDMFLKSNPLPPEDYITLFLKEAYRSKELCRPILPVTSLTKHSVQNVMMITDCAEESQLLLELKEKCRNAETEYLKNSDYRFIVPVLGDDGKVYRNGFCAYCNGVQKFTKYDIEFENCNNDVLRKSEYGFASREELVLDNILTKIDGCLVSLSTHQKQHISADKGAAEKYTRCNIPHKYEEFQKESVGCTEREFQMCQSFVALCRLPGTMEVLRNPYCELCHHPHVSGIDLYHCSDDYKNFMKDGRVLTSFSVMISFGLETRIDLYKKSSQITYNRVKCMMNEIFDLSRERCIPMPCKLGFKLVSSGCVQIEEKISSNQNDPCTSDCAQAHCLQNKGVVVIKNQSDCKHFKKEGNEYRLFMIKEMLLSIKVLKCEDSMELLQVINTTTVRIIDAVATLNISTYQIFLISHDYKSHIIKKSLHIPTFPRNLLCTNALSVIPNNSQDCACMTKPYCMSQSNMTYWYKLKSNKWDLQISLCKKLLSSQECQNFLNFKIEAESPWNRTNHSAMKNHDNRNLQVLCSSDTPPVVYSWQEKLEKVEKVSTISILAFSITANILTTIIYMSKRELCTIVGLNIISFCLTVLATDVIILILAVQKVCQLCCKVFAICLHWFSLASQLWTLLIISDLIKTVGRRFVRRRATPLQSVIYNAIVWSVTTAIVLVCVLLDHYHPNKVAYGLNGICWLGSQEAKVFAYLLPTVVVEVANFLLLFVLLKNRLALTGDGEIDEARRSLIKNYGRLMLKIVILFGILEVVGLLQFGDENEQRRMASAIFRLLHSVFRSLRGTFIFIVLVVMSQQASPVLLRIFKREGTIDNGDSLNTSKSQI